MDQNGTTTNGTKPPKSSLLYRFLLLVTVFVISYLAFTPLDHPVASGLNDKANHLLAFLCLSLLLDFSFPRRSFGMSKVLPLLAYGITIELVQHILPFRFFSLFDLAADALGIALYPALLAVLKRIPGISRLLKAVSPLRN